MLLLRHTVVVFSLGSELQEKGHVRFGFFSRVLEGRFHRLVSPALFLILEWKFLVSS